MTRKSKREIEQRLDELDADPADEYPTVTLAGLFSWEWEPVDENPNLKRRKETGEIYYHPPIDLEELGES